MLTEIIKELTKLKNPEKAKALQRFFKTGRGEYGEGDVFWGIIVPKQREVARKFFKEISLKDIEKLLHSRVHEYRLTALIILTMKYKDAQKHWIPGPSKDGQAIRDDKKKDMLFVIFDLYLRDTKWINNWDLVDLSAPHIIGEYIYNNAARYPEERERRRIPSFEILYKLAKSSSLWERRIAILSTFTFIRQNDFAPSIKIAEMLLHDNHDLIHKAVGWMLREVGKRDKEVLVKFLNKYHKEIPRVMLRYAVEKFSNEEKRRW